jgi:hypothetical protein
MLRATRNAIVQLSDGSEVRLHKHVSHVAPGHELARKYSRYFEHAPCTASVARERILGVGTANMVSAPAPAPRSASGKRPAWKILASPPRCQFRDRLGMTRIRMDGPAYQRMLALAEQTKRDGKETGGVAVGAISPSLVEIPETHGPSANAIREPNRFAMDVEANLALAVKVRDESDGALTPCCIWHTHPRSTRDVSTFDMTSLSTWREAFDVDQLVGLVVVPTRSGFDVEPYVVHRGAGDRDICERASLTVT